MSLGDTLSYIVAGNPVSRKAISGVSDIAKWAVSFSIYSLPVWDNEPALIRRESGQSRRQHRERWRGQFRKQPNWFILRSGSRSAATVRSFVWRRSVVLAPCVWPPTAVTKSKTRRNPRIFAKFTKVQTTCISSTRSYCSRFHLFVAQPW